MLHPLYAARMRFDRTLTDVSSAVTALIQNAQHTIGGASQKEGVSVL